MKRKEREEKERMKAVYAVCFVFCREKQKNNRRVRANTPQSVKHLVKHLTVKHLVEYKHAVITCL